MSREIKFRAWDKEKKSMFQIFDSTTLENWFLPSWNDKYEVMQYTGLHDKNGKEIYEGDVVKCKNYHGVVYGIINYNNSYFYLACSSGYSDEYLFNCSDIKIISNIHESPELLTEDK